MRIHEVPVDWVDDPDSRVDIVATALADLQGVARVGRALATGALPLASVRAALGRGALAPGSPPAMLGQLIRFALIGVASTAAYALLYLALQRPLGPQWANAVALLLTAVANTAANRAFTFGVRGRRGAGRHQVQGLVVLGFALVVTGGSLAALHRFVPGAAPPLELATLVIANLVATLVRFIGLRWVFRRGAAEGATP